MRLTPRAEIGSKAALVVAALAVYVRVPVLIVLLLGFSAGLPLALTGDTLRVWMADRGLDLGTIGLRGRDQAGAHLHTVEQYRAGAAVARLATDLGAGQTELAAQRLSQRGERRRCHPPRLTVEREGDRRGVRPLDTAIDSNAPGQRGV